MSAIDILVVIEDFFFEVAYDEGLKVFGLNYEFKLKLHNLLPLGKSWWLRTFYGRNQIL